MELPAALIHPPQAIWRSSSFTNANFLLTKLTMPSSISSCFGHCLWLRKPRTEPIQPAVPLQSMAPAAPPPVAEATIDKPLRITSPDRLRRTDGARLQKQLLTNLSTRRRAATHLPPSQALHAALRQPGATTSNLLDILEPDQFTEVPLRHVGAKVVWFNRHLLQEIEPDVDWSDATLTPELEAAIVDRYAYTVHEELRLGRQAGPAVAYGKADHYRVANDDMQGAGRAVFLPGGEYSKGAGRTGLGPSGTTHQDGLCGLEEALVEAAAGEACAELLNGMSTRVLAVLLRDPPPQKDASGDVQRDAAIIIRLGMPLRPAHFLDIKSNGKPRSYHEKAMERAMERMFGPGHTDRQDRIVHPHARLAAAMRRYGLLHGTLDESNMGLTGTALDFGTFTAQPHGAPMFSWSIRALGNHLRHNFWIVDARIFGSEHRAAAEILMKPLRLEQQWAVAWRRAKAIASLSALGLPEPLAQQALVREPDSAHLLAKHMRRVGRYYYGDESWNAKEHWDTAVKASVADTFQLHRELATAAFDFDNGSRRALTEAQLFELLDFRHPPGGRVAVSTGWQSRAAVNKYAVTSENQLNSDLNESLKEIVKHYTTVMEAAREAGMEDGRWADRVAFVRCIAARADFENRPLYRLFRPNLQGKINSPLRAWQAHGAERNAVLGTWKSLLEVAIARSRRNVDRMLFHTPIEPGSTAGSWRLPMRKIDGILFYLEADLAGERRLCVEISAARLDDRARATFLDEGSASNGVLKLTRHVEPDEYREVANDFDQDGISPFPAHFRAHYFYAVPDAYELAQITAASPLAAGDIPP